MMTDQQNKSGATPQMADDERKIAELLGSLRRVSPPADFYTRVRAGIARGSSESRGRPLWLPTAIRAAVPLGLVVVVGGYFAVDRYNRDANAPVGDLVASYSAPAAIDLPLPVTNSIAAPSTVPPQEASSPNPRLSARTSPEPARNSRRTSSDGPELDSGGSYVESVRPGRRVLPTGINPDPIKATPAEAGTDRSIAVREVLNVIGVTARFNGAGWKVDSVTPGSSAQKAGIVAGDIIDSINDQGARRDTAFAGEFTTNSVKVIRAGRPITISLVKE